jgi:succinate dehydrogenase / fumarate reductase, cytochrome b subunit
MSTPSAAVKKRPKHLDIAKIRLPLPAVVSILHRVSGAVMFLVLIPVLLSSLDASLASQESFEDLRFALGNPLLKIIVIGLAWSFIHHFFAGIRYLLLDLHIGIDLPTTRLMSKIVLVIGGILTLFVAVAIW